MLRLSLKRAFTGLRQRRLQVVVTTVVVAVAAGTLALALDVGRVADRPFERTLAATNGAHVTVWTFGRDQTDLEQVAKLPGGTDSTGLVPGLFTAFAHDGRRCGLNLLGVEPTPPRVQRPQVVAGRWPGESEVPLERSFARFLGLGPGDTITTLGGPTLTVSGVAVLPVGEAYPRSQPGLALALPATLEAVEPDVASWGRAIGVRIAEPEEADAFARRVRALVGPAPSVETWLEARTESADLTHTVTIILSVYSTLLLLTVGSVLATLVGGRIAAQSTQIGLLKAAGLTPRQVAGLLLAEQLAVATLGCALGLMLGRLATPFFTEPSAALLSASETPPLDPVRSLLVAGVVLGLVALFTLVPALRVARRTTAHCLQGGLATAGGRSRLGRLADRVGLPLPAVLSARRRFARPGHSGLATLNLALAVVAIVGTLGMEASLNIATVPPPAPPIVPGLPEVPAWDPVDDDAGEGATLRPVVYGLDGLLLLVGLTSLLATLVLTTREQTRDLGVLKAVGLTPRQLLGTVLSSQGVVALAAGLVGIPLGLGLFRLAIQLSGSTDEFAYPAVWTLPVIVVGVVGAVVAIATPLSRWTSSLRVADALRYE